MTTTAPYGAWRSPITPELLVEDVVTLGFPRVEGDITYWVETRPSERGRQVVVALGPEGTPRDVIPAGFSARTLVHEYGGACVAVHDGAVMFSNFEDQRVYRIADGSAPVPVTDLPPEPRTVRWADQIVTTDGALLIAVRERHLPGEVVNDIAAVPVEGGPVRVIAEGHDFFSAPRQSPDGARLAWLSWDHPRMPWDGTELWEASLDGASPRLVAGGDGESISQPRYAPDGTLHFVSDRTGWWNLYADDGGSGRPLAAMDAEFAGPDWVFGQSTYTFLDDGTVVAVWSAGGRQHLGMLGPDGFGEVETPFGWFGAVVPRKAGIVAVGGGPGLAPAVVEIDLPTGEHRVLKRSRRSEVDPGYVSLPRPVEFPTEGGLTSHALFYPPANRDFRGPDDERPPLLVLSHGGPTGAARSTLDYSIQFWTSRGVAVVDVDYGGSAGYGRDYRQRLQAAWGVVDVDDCVNAARWLAANGEVDGRRMSIKGGSAGGYTTLCAVTFRDVFAAGSSHFGVADVGALARDTHKFESRYLDGLIGPWPEARAVYEARSPIFHTELMRTPLILFQGLEDAVVPPNQAEMMAAALDAKGVPHALVMYEGEQHGFRNAENITRTAGLELGFFGCVLGFTPADAVPELDLRHAEALRHP